MSYKEKIKETAEKIDGTIRKDYSGRGMFGRTCWGKEFIK